ncbi:hypothetical protein GW17_00023226, partial [Ensete ventricosum]
PRWFGAETAEEEEEGDAADDGGDRPGGGVAAGFRTFPDCMPRPTPLKARSLGFPKPYIHIPLSCSTPAMPEEDSGTPEAVFRCSRKLGVSETRDRRPSSESRRNTGISR